MYTDYIVFKDDNYDVEDDNDNKEDEDLGMTVLLMAVIV